jgi:hypothetical protein
LAVLPARGEGNDLPGRFGEGCKPADRRGSASDHGGRKEKIKQNHGRRRAII